MENKTAAKSATKSKPVTKDITITAEQFLAGINRVTSALEKVEQLGANRGLTRAMGHSDSMQTEKHYAPDVAAKAPASSSPEPSSVACLIRELLSISSERATQAIGLELGIRNGFTPLPATKFDCMASTAEPEHGMVKENLLSILRNLATIERCLEAIATYTVA